MNFKRINAVLTLMLLVLGICVPAVNAAGAKITFGSMTATQAGENTRVCVTAEKVPEERSVTLVAAYVKKGTGEILSINSSAALLAADGDVLEVTLQDKSGEDAELRYFVWDSLASRSALRNGAPTAPAAAEQDSATINSATISWTDAADDYGRVEKYNIYDEGMLVVEGVIGNSATVENLAWGSSYNLEVKAVDDENAESVLSAPVAVTTAEVPGSVTAGDTITDDTEKRLEFFLSTGENYNATKPTTAGGVACRQTILTPGGRSTFLNYKFSPQYMQTIEDQKEFVLELTYFDEGTEPISINLFGYLDDKGKDDQAYVSSGLIDGSTMPQKQNTMTWKTARVKFKFPGHFSENTNAGNGFFNFRVKDNDPQGGLKVYKFAVAPKSEYNPMDAYFKAESATFTCGLNTAAATSAPVEKEGRNAVRLSTFTFAVTDKEVQAKDNAYIELNYYADADDAIVLGADEYPLVKGKWQKLKLNLGAVGTGGHTIQTKSGGEIYIHSVRVVAPQA